MQLEFQVVFNDYCVSRYYLGMEEKGLGMKVMMLAENQDSMSPKIFEAIQITE